MDIPRFHPDSSKMNTIFLSDSEAAIDRQGRDKKNKYYDKKI